MLRLSLFLTFLLAGCATIQPQRAGDDLRATLESRSDVPVVWRTTSEADSQADAAIAELLADSLSADEAVQVALLNNRYLQATYEDLGIAQAALVQAGLLRNPVFGGRALWSLDEPAAPNFGFTAALDFLNVFALPLRKAVARSEYEAARRRVANAVLDHAARTRKAYTDAQADRLRMEMQGRIVANAEAAYQAALLLREAGNIPPVDLLAEQTRFEAARLDLVRAELAVTESREALAREMGVWGAQASFRLGGRLEPVPDAEPLAGDASSLDVAEIEHRAVEASLALVAARADAEAIARRLGIGRLEAVLPDLEIGGELERDEGEWEAGPEVHVVLPLFDQGQARQAAGWSELRRARARYEATIVDVRSAARVLAARLAATRQIALQYQRVLLDLGAELSAQTLREYNAMQTGVFGLLQAQQQEADAAQRYADALAAYWNVRTDLEALLQGRMPDLGASGIASSESSAPMRDAGH
ncbi:MAG: TolC family protein [Rubricoccaceae bacterium]